MKRSCAIFQLPTLCDTQQDVNEIVLFTHCCCLGILDTTRCRCRKLFSRITSLFVNPPLFIILIKRLEQYSCRDFRNHIMQIFSVFKVFLHMIYFMQHKYHTANSTARPSQFFFDSRVISGGTLGNSLGPVDLCEKRTYCNVPILLRAGSQHSWYGNWFSKDRSERLGINPLSLILCAQNYLQMPVHGRQHMAATVTSEGPHKPLAQISGYHRKYTE